MIGGASAGLVASVTSPAAASPYRRRPFETDGAELAMESGYQSAVPLLLSLGEWRGRAAGTSER